MIQTQSKYDATKYKTPTGTKLSCKGWIQEAALRMLLNNLDPEVAEKPDELIVYGGRGKAARNFEALDNMPVNTIFMLIGRENTVGTHLRLLSRISRLMNNDAFRSEVTNAQTSDEAFALFEREEATIS